MQLPLETVEFRLRMHQLGDAEAVARLRSDPTTAQWQSWATPYSVERARQAIADLMEVQQPMPGKWWGVVIADLSTDAYLGNVVFCVAEHGHTAEIGYGLNVDQRGKGIAGKAVQLVVDALFARPEIQRVEASLHPDNIASATLLERLGMQYEGTSRSSYWVDGVNSDDPHSALLRSDYEAWCNRVVAPPGDVRLIEISEANLKNVWALRTHQSQLRFVAPIVNSLAEALVPPLEKGEPLRPWFRAIEADGELVGFVMLADVTATSPVPYLWRLMIDRMHQKRGIAHRVLDLLVADRRAKGDTQLMVSFMPGLGSPMPMYMKFGFVLTGNVDDHGEIEAVLDLDEHSRRKDV